MMNTYTITFQPDNKSVTVDTETTILSAALSAGITINADCGGDGVCGRCKIRIKSGKVTTQPSGIVSLEEKRENIYLACMTTVHSDTEVEILPASRLDFTHLSKEEVEFRLKGLYSNAEEVAAAGGIPGEPEFVHDPLTTRLFLEIPKPDLTDRISDLERLYRQIRRKRDVPVLQTGLMNIRRLGKLVRDSEWKVTVTLGAREGTVEIILIEPGDTSEKHYGICFDIGTTTITGQLIDLRNNTVLSTKASYNQQANFGSDVISRILHAKQGNGLEQLHDAVVDTMNQIITQLTGEHGIDLNTVTSVVCAGNPTMIHLLLSIDPAYIRQEPYTPTANFLPVIRAQEADIHVNPRGILSCMPGVASYVGADTVAGVLSSGIYKANALSLLIDIGTNGEIVLGDKEFLVACAASAGPAFEGSGVSCGMRASSQAIQKIAIDPATFDVTCETIGGNKPGGICGSGYIHLLRQMLRAGIIDKSGAIKPDNHRRIRNGKDGREFIVVFKDEARIDYDIVITESDIENLKRAKGALYAATEVLLKYMDLDMSMVEKIYIAGGFGTYLDMESAIAIGLLPDVERSRFAFIGNSSLAGARHVLLSADAGRMAEKIAKTITYCELSVEPGYMDAYMAALFFPHTDLNKFPSIQGPGV